MAPSPGPSRREGEPPVPAQEVIAIRARPASVLARFASWLVDLAILVGAATAYFAILRTAKRAGIPLSTSETGLDYLVDRVVAYRQWLLPGIVAALCFQIAYAAGCAMLLGRTLGGWLLRVHIVDRRGRRPGPVRAMWRSVAGLLGAGVLLMGFWLVVFTRGRRALHDILSGTHVVRLLRPLASPTPPVASSGRRWALWRNWQTRRT